MYARNHATPETIAIGPVVQISDGAVQTTGCTVRIIPDGVAEGDGGGPTAYSTDGVVLYTPTQAETNYTSFLLIAKKTGCIPTSITVVTTASATNGNVVLSGETHTSAVIPSVTTVTGNVDGSVGSLTGHTVQTGDSFALANGAAGFAAIDTNVDTLIANQGDWATATGFSTHAATDIVSAGAITTLTGAVVNVDSVDTITTYTGNTLQTGDTFALANGATGFTAIDTVVDTILADTADMQPKLGTPAADIAADIAAVKAETALIVADTGELQTDWANTGRLDTILDTAASGGSAPTAAAIRTEIDSNSTQLAAIVEDTGTTIPGTITTLQATADAIPTTAMRGTDSAALASVATEARLAELDAGNLPTDIAAIPTTAMRGTDNSATASVLGAAVGASISADIAAVKAETALVVADTNELQTDDVPGLIAALNDVAATDIVSAGAITTLTGAVVNVDLVDVLTTYTGNTLQTGDVSTLITTVGTAGDGLTNITLANDLSTTMKTSVQTAVDAAIDTAISELTVAAPTATPTLRTGLMLLYMALRNKLIVQTSGTDALEVHNDAGTKIASKAITDDTSDYTEAKMS